MYYQIRQCLAVIHHQYSEPLFFVHLEVHYLMNLDFDVLLNQCNFSLLFGYNYLDQKKIITKMYINSFI